MGNVAVFSDQLPGLDKIGGGVNTRTAAFAAWNSITALLSLPTDAAKWEDVSIAGKVFKVPKGFRVSVGQHLTSVDTVGSGRDEYMRNVTASLSASGKYGGFSGTLKSSFNMTENTTSAYSFATHTFEYQLYSLTLPSDVSGLLDPKFKADLENPGLSPADFYATYGTHYTSSILIGGRSSLSLFTQLQKKFESSTIAVDVSAAYETIAAKFQTSGSFKYESSHSGESYRSNTSLVLVGGNPLVGDMAAWKASVAAAPQFINFNTQDASGGLVPFYRLLEGTTHTSRLEALKAALPDYLNPPLELRIFAAASLAVQHPSATVEVPAKYKVLSGGAMSAWQGAGQLLTASYPISNNQWSAAAKDAGTADSAVLTVYALAIYDPYDWLDISVTSATSGAANHPSKEVGVAQGYTLTGGGAKVTYTNAGNYLTASYPKDTNTWAAQSKDHESVDMATITAYAIGIKLSPSAPKGLSIATQISSATSTPEQHPSAKVSAPSGTVMVGGGAQDVWKGNGNMLWASYPSDGTTWSAAAKDHDKTDLGTLTAYVIGVKGLVSR